MAGEVKNVEMKQDGNMLTITVDMSKDFGPSKSGKTVIIASTGGAVPHPDDNAVSVNLNIYRKK
jgi:hypothetical protein